MGESSAGAERLVRALETASIRDPRLLDACRYVLRARFVPAGSEDEASMDQPIRIGLEQVTTQPSLGERIVALRLDGDERVPEIGKPRCGLVTGSPGPPRVGAQG